MAGVVSPSISPDLAHLPAFLATGFVALFCIGLGSLGGARRAETGLVAGWGMTGLGTVIIGTLTTLPVSLAMGAAALLGGLGWVRIAWGRMQGRPVLDSAGFGRVLLLAVPLLVLIESLNPANWDDFSHWLLNARYLVVYGHFPTLALPNPGSGHAGYPYGMALPAYGVALLTGQWSTSAGIVWSALVLLAACAAIAGAIEEQFAAPGQPAGPGAAWAAAGLALLFGVMLSPVFTPKFSLSNTADGVTGAVLALLCRELAAMLQRQGATRRLAVLAAVAVAFVNLRQTNLVLLVLAIGGFASMIALARRRVAVADQAPWLVALIAGAATWWLWNRYAQVQIPGGQFVWLPRSAWRWSMLGTIAAAVARTMLVKGGFYLLAAVAGLSAIRTIRSRDPDGRAAAVLPGAVVLLIAGNTAFLTFTYLAASFGDEEAKAAASFWRYSEQAGLALTLVLAQIIPWRRLALPWPARITAAACLGAAFAPLMAPAFVRYDLRNSALSLRAEADEIAWLWHWRGPLDLLDIRGNGYVPMVIAYRLHELALGTAKDAVPVGVWSLPSEPPLSGAALREAVKADDVWISEGGALANALTTAPLDRRCSYLLTKGGTGFGVGAAWPDSRGGAAC